MGASKVLLLITKSRMSECRIIRIYDYSTHLASPIYLHSAHAWYILKLPADAYRLHAIKFLQDMKICQYIISTAIQYPNASPRRLRDSLNSYLSREYKLILPEDISYLVSGIS